jgi:hypothetical protein
MFSSMTLDELLNGDEALVTAWLRDEGLLHECDCGYTVYDPDNVNSAVQTTWGDERCDEIYSWACGLADKHGWLFLESAQPEFGIYHCQYCEESEWSLFMDLEKIAESAESVESEPTVSSVVAELPKKNNEHLVVYIDESYSDQFPRSLDGSLAYAALIIPQSQVENLENRVAQIRSESYRGRPARELKYNKLSKRPGLLERIGLRVVALLREFPEARIVGIYVPQRGYFGEKKRSIIAVSHYGKTRPNDADLQRVDSTDSIEAAVTEVPNNLAHLVASCVSSFVGSHAASAKIIFDPRSKELDEGLEAKLENFVPSIPIKVPLLKHAAAIVMPWPTASSERIGNRISYGFLRSSHELPGLQLADFLAGDIRTFFNEVQELLDAATTTDPLVNRRVMFPEAFRVGRISNELLGKLHNRIGKSFLPQYRRRLVNRRISYYTGNGQMRNLDTETGEVFDLMD